jgi:hypothetical protein
MTLKLESPLWDDTQVEYVLLPGSGEYMVGDDLDVIGWNILVRLPMFSYCFPSAAASLIPGIVQRWDAVTMGNYYKAFDQTYSQLRIYVEMERQSSYYLNRLVTNVGLLVFMAFFASTLRPDVPERTIAVMTVFLCIVTWEFVIIGA